MLLRTTYHIETTDDAGQWYRVTDPEGIADEAEARAALEQLRAGGATVRLVRVEEYLEGDS